MQNLCFKHADSRSRSQMKAAGDIAVLQTACLYYLSLFFFMFLVCIIYTSLRLMVSIRFIPSRVLDPSGRIAIWLLWLSCSSYEKETPRCQFRWSNPVPR